MTNKPKKSTKSKKKGKKAPTWRKANPPGSRMSDYPTERKHLDSGPPADMAGKTKNVPFNAPDYGIKNNRQLHFMTNIGDNTKAAVYALLQPKESLRRGINASVPDSSFRPIYRWATKYVQTLGTSANTASGSQDVVISCGPTGLEKGQYSTAFNAGTVTASTKFDDPSYPGWATYFEAFRMVAMEIQLRNSSKLSDIGGICAVGRTQRQTDPADPFLGKSFNAYATNTDASIHTLGKPGDVMKTVWFPFQRNFSATGNTNNSSDWNFQPPDELGNAQDTLVFIWCQCPVAATFEVEITCHFEAILLPGTNQLLVPVTIIQDPTVFQQLLAMNLAESPLTDQIRNVETDDGPIASVVRDAKTIFGAGKSIFGVAKKAWSTFKGLFSHIKDEDELLKNLLLMEVDPKVLLGLNNSWIRHKAILEEKQDGKSRTSFAARVVRHFKELRLTEEEREDEEKDPGLSRPPTPIPRSAPIVVRQSGWFAGPPSSSNPIERKGG
jgi:hypothetical protein